MVPSELATTQFVTISLLSKKAFNTAEHASATVAWPAGKDGLLCGPLRVVFLPKALRGSVGEGLGNMSCVIMHPARNRQNCLGDPRKTQTVWGMKLEVKGSAKPSSVVRFQEPKFRETVGFGRRKFGAFQKSFKLWMLWSGRRESDPQPTAWKAVGRLHHKYLIGPYGPEQPSKNLVIREFQPYRNINGIWNVAFNHHASYDLFPIAESVSGY